MLISNIVTALFFVSGFVYIQQSLIPLSFANLSTYIVSIKIPCIFIFIFIFTRKFYFNDHVYEVIVIIIYRRRYIDDCKICYKE